MTGIPRRPRASLLGGAALLAAVAIATLVFRRDGATAACCPGARLHARLEPALDYTVDSLPNGLRYYLRAHPSSDDRAELRLVVDAGSVQEADDQRGLAHAVEHMVFRGTRRFPGGAVERWFESIGMRRGDGINATTSFDETEFRMTVPATRAGAIDTALAMLASMVHEATFDAADARAEAGVILEEWRRSRDVDARIEDARHPVLYAGMPYAARPVIGDTSVLRRFDVAAMRRYYEAWYRPELMAVVAVGEFDAAEVEALVKRHFGAIPARRPRRARPVAPVPDSARGAPRAVVVTDPEARSTRVGTWHPTGRRRYRVRGDYRAALVGRLWRDVLRGRLEDATQRAGSPIAGAEVEYRTLSRALGADVVDVTTMSGRALPALEAVAGELRALARGGPTSAELEERRRALLEGTEAGAQDGDGISDIAAELVDHFLTGSAVLTSRSHWELARDLLPTVSVEDVRDYARARTPDGNALVVVAAPAHDTAARYPADTIVARARAARGGTSGRPAEPLDPDRLLAREPVPGEIVSEREIPEVRAYEWTLSNGMRLLLKPTAYAFDEVRLRAVAPGGASLVDDDRYASAYLSDAIMRATGLGDVPAPRLRRWLESTSISLSTTVTDDAIFLDGFTEPAEMMTLFRLLHLQLTAPRRDTVAFRRYHERMAAFVRERGGDPDAIFRDSVTRAFAGSDPRAIRQGAPFYLGTRLDEALDFWRQRTANGAGFTVAVVGDFTLADMRPLARRYLASIPRGTAEHPRDRGVRRAAGGTRRDLVAGSGPRARAAIGFTAPVALTNENVNALQMVREVVDRTLAARLREQMGGTYYVDVSLDIELEPPTRYRISVEFEADPARLDGLVAAAAGELARLHREGPTAAQFEGAREARVRDFDGRMQENGYWLGELTFHARHGWSLAGIGAHPDEVKRMTLEDARRACAAFIPAGDYVRVTMRPRGTTPVR